LRIGVLGAGATGLAAARDLVLAGHDVTVLEGSGQIGGLAASLKIGGTWVERFYHHLFGTDHDAIELIEAVGLGGRLEFHPASTGIYIDGHLHDFSTPLDMLRLPPLPLRSRLRFGAASAILKATPRWQRLENVGALDWTQRWSGAPATDVVWRPLLEGKFGQHARDISMAWLWARVHYRTFRLGYLRGGFALFYEALLDDVRRRGGDVRLDAPVSRITARAGGASSRFGGVTVEAGGQLWRFDRVLATLPEPVFARAAGLPAEAVSRRTYLGATCLILELNRSLIPFYWLNINDPAFPFLAVVEHTRMVPPADYDGRHVVYVGNYTPVDDARYTADPTVLLDGYLPYLQRLDPDLRRDDIVAWHISRAPYAQPIVTAGYRNTLPAHETSLPGVLLATMSQVYPQDRGQNYAIAMGRRVAKMLVA